MGNAISSPRPKQTTFYGLTVDLLNLTSCETVDLCLVLPAAGGPVTIVHCSKLTPRFKPGTPVADVIASSDAGLGYRSAMLILSLNFSMTRTD